jgi:hypothetical protein
MKVLRWMLYFDTAGGIRRGVAKWPDAGRGRVG